MKMNPVVHFEFPAQDRKRISEFYHKAFGWKTQDMGPQMGNYIVVTTSESDEKGFPTKPGSINGGFYQHTKEMGEMHPSVVISVDDIHEAIKKVKEAGGKVTGDPMPIPNVGLYMSFIDTEGNRVTLLQPKGWRENK